MLYKATHKTSTAAAASGTSGKAKGIAGSDVGYASAAISETVSAMLDGATSTVVAASEGRAPQVILVAPEERSTTSFAEAATVPPPLSSPPGSSMEHISGVELFGSGDRDEEGEPFERDEQAVQDPAAETIPSPMPEHLRKDSAGPPNAATRTRASEGEIEPVVTSDAGRAHYDEGNKHDVREGPQQEKDMDESESKQQEQGHDVQEDNTKEDNDGEKAQNIIIEKEEGKENEGGKEKLESFLGSNGQVVYSSRPEDGATVWVLGRREGATVQVVEQLHPLYQLIVSVRAAANTPLPTERTVGHDDNRTNHHLPSSETAKEVEDSAMEGSKAVIVASISLGKPEIKEALESWVRSSVFAAASSASTSRPLSDGIAKTATNGTTRTAKGMAATSSSEAADAGLRRWITTGRSPRRAHLVRWLLKRLELVQVAVKEEKYDPGKEDRQLYGREKSKSWSLVISDCNVNGSEKKVDDRATGDVDESKARSQQRGGFEEEKGEKVDNPLTPGDSAVGAAVERTAAPQIAPWQRAEGGGGRGGGEGGRGGKDGWQQQCHWWDNENPWSRGSRPSATVTSSSSDGGPSGSGSGSGSARSPPPYQEAAPPPAYQESIEGPAATPYTSLAHKSGSGKLRRSAPCSQAATISERLPLSGSAISSDDASASSGGGTSRGPPPSYRFTTKGEALGLSLSPMKAGEEEKEHHSVGDLPPPSYGRFYDRISGTAATLSRPETKSSNAKSDAADWWAQDDDQRYFKQKRPEIRRERERIRSRQRLSSGGADTDSDRSHAFSGGATGKSETSDGEQRLDKGGEASRGRSPLRHSAGWRRRSYTTTGVSRSKETMPTPPGETRGVRKDTTPSLPPSGTEGWDDERWRLTRYLQACKKELTVAEECRRRAETAANAAERTAWKTAAGNGGGDDAARRAWARAATQRVLDLMLVTERVRQEEQKRRVAAARANNQVARCKQPFRERRGRSQKGPFIGPSVPSMETTETPSRSQQRMEATLNDFYWDEHGRRYHRGGRGVAVGDGIDGHSVETSDEVDVAMETVRKLAAACFEKGMDFGQPFRDMDADGDGRLTLAEMGAALRRTGARLTLSQVTALFRHFGGGRLALGTVDRGEFLWEFIDKRRLLKQWRRAGEGSGGHRARMAPFQHRAKAASYGRGNGSDGTLSRHDMSQALEDLGVHVDGWEAGALFDRFGVKVDEGERVDWVAFASFLKVAENKEDGNDNSNDSKKRQGVATRSGGKERSRLRTTHSRRGKGGHAFLQQHQPRATTRLHRGGGLFEEEGGGATWSHPTPPTQTQPPPTTSTTGGKSFAHWASSAPTSGGYHNTTIYEKQIPLARSRSAAGSRSSSWEMMTTLPPSGSRRGRRGEMGEGWVWQRKECGGRLATSTAQASKVLDGLLADQRELEVFLEEEFAKREGEAV